MNPLLPNRLSQPSQAHAGSQPASRVLIVEDERIIAYDLQLRLTQMGFDVVDVVSSGADAIDSVIKFRPDVVLMDVVIEGDMDGIETAIAIQKDGPLPIVFVTAFSDDSTFERARGIQEFAYVLKPFQERELHLTIRTVLQKFVLQKRLRESEAWYRSLFAQTMEPMILLDNEGNIKDVNTAAKQLLGPTNLRKTSIFQLFPQAGQLYIKQKWNRLLDKGRVSGRFKLEFKADHRKVLFLEIRIQANLSTGVHLATLNNATARMESERKIQELARTSSDSPHPIIRFSKRGQLLYYNKAALPFIFHWGNAYQDELPPRLMQLISLMGDNKPLIKTRIKLNAKLYSVRLVYIRDGQYVNFYATDVTALRLGQVFISSQRDALDLIARGAPLTTLAKRMAELIVKHLPAAKVAFFTPDGPDNWVPIRATNPDAQILTKILKEEYHNHEVLSERLGFGTSYSILERERVLELVKKFEPDRKAIHTGFVVYPVKAIKGDIPMVLVVKWRRISNHHDGVMNLLRMVSYVMSVALERDANMRSLSQQALLFANINDSIVMLDTHGHVTDWNQSCERLFGFSKAEVMNKHLDQLHLLPNGPAVAHLMRDTKTVVQEVTYHAREGREGAAEMSVVPLYDSGGVIMGTMLVFRDITIRKHYEEHIRQSEANLTALIENTEDIICSLNLRGQVITANTAFHQLLRRILGHQPNNTNSNQLLHLLPNQLAQDIDKYVRAALEGDRQSVEFTIPLQDGENMVLETSFNPMRDAHNKLEGVSIYGRDITARKAAEDELKRTNFELDSFVYRASHDLRAPLRSILGLLNLMDIDKSEASQSQYITLVRTSINKLDTFIADLTHYSRNSRTEVEPEAVDFLQIIEDCLENLKYMDRAGRVKIYTDVYGNSTFYSDPGRLTVVFQNLISNALKYQDLEKTDPFLKIRVSSGARNAQILIEDNGKGIKSDYHTRIFDMFFRASDESYGSGLGLYITRQVIDKLKGSIAVSSELGKGTTFAITIPNLNAQEPGPDERRSQLQNLKWFEGQ